MKKLFLLFLLFAFLNSNNPEVLAQSGSTTANIIGIVKDPENAVIAGASITVKQIDTNLTRSFETNQEGAFQIIQLPPGNYEISVSASGYNTFKATVTLTLGATLLSEVNLSLANTSEVIEVTADNPFSEVKTESSNVNGQDRIESLPINRRDFLDFALTSPRVTPDRVPNQGIFSTSGLSFNGQSGRFNNITIDGLDNNDINQGAVRATFSQEAVREFQVVSDGYSAEFGRALSGVVNIVTKGGGNQYHGSLFFLNRNDEISARDSFDKTKSPYSQYQFGATLSGPIKKDKAFFFTSFERLTIKQNIFVTIADQTVQAAKNLGYPANNGTEPFPIGSTSFLARADFRIKENDTFWVRYNNNFGFNGAFEPFGGLTDRTSSGDLNVEDNSLALNNTFISPGLNLVNETRFLYSRRDQESLPVNTDAGIQLFAPEGTVSFGHNNFVPEFNFQRITQIVNITSLTRGKQQIKFGGDFTYISRPPKKNGGLFPDGFGVFSPVDFASLFGMPGLPSLTGLEAFDPSLRNPQQRVFLTAISGALGLPSNINLANESIPLLYLQGFGDDEIELKSKLFSTFIQDDIRLKQNLILKLGARYDVNRIDFTPSNNGNVSPRFSVAYRPTKLPKVSLHAGYGLFFTVPFTRSTLSARSSELGLRLLFVPFPLSVIPFSFPGHKFSGQAQIPSAIPFIPQLNLTTQYQKDLRSSYSQQINTGIDYLLGNNTVFSISYNFIRGIKLLSLRDTNPVVNPVPNNPVQSQIVGRLDPTRGSVLEFESAYDSYYHAISFLVNRRFSKLNFLAHYTFSKGIDNIADFSVTITDRANDPLNLSGERGLSVQDTRSRFVFSSTWDLSYTKNPFLRDFQLSSIISLNSGRPYNLLAGVDLNQNGDGGLSDRPMGLGRNVGITPGFASVDMRLTRTLTIKENYKIHLFAEGFNLFNRVNINPNLINRTFLPDAQGNFNLPPQEDGRYILTPDRYRGGFAPRQFQLGFRVTF
ncbi:MAG: TonB-dependent receptor [Acidobacteria bacterium]|nr:TonB-dependent receptor [Acidobacteriota bacterium]